MEEGPRPAVSPEWERLKQAREVYQGAIFDWCHLNGETKRQDLLPELKGTLQQQLRVSDFLQSTELWDHQAVATVYRELVEEALDGQEEVAAWSMRALLKLKHRPIRRQIAEELWKVAERADREDWWVFHNGYLLLYGLGCKRDLFRFIERFRAEIGEDELDEQDWREFEAMPDEDGENT